MAAAQPAVEFPRPPIVTRLESHSATLQWRQSVSVPLTLIVGAQRIDLGAGLVRRVRVAGLRPGRRLTYRLVHDERVVASGSFVLPLHRRAPFTAVAYGDYGQNSDAQRRVAAVAAAWKPALFVALGDNVYPFGFSLLMDRNALAPIRQLLSVASFVPALGNHDVLVDGGRSWLDALDLPGAERWFVQRHNGAAFIVLDSTSDVSPASPQGRFLRGALRQTASSCPRVVALHHPPWSEHTAGIAPELRRHVVPLLERARVDLVLDGHVHSYARSKPRRGVTYVTAGTGGTTIGGAVDSTIPLAARVLGTYGALRLDFDGGGVKGSFVTDRGVVEDRFSLPCVEAR